MKELEKVYDPQKTESRIYQMWESSGYFSPDINPDGEAYTIVMPPPNITGQLHIGHAFDCTLQDILIRYKRMQGYAALWLPGEDHASIATEVKVTEKIHNDSGRTKDEIGREEFLKIAWEWSDFYRNRIAQQLRKLGSSCDWERERFTMDEGCSEAVKKAFVRLYEKGLIYRDYRIINWCPDCSTALSEAEVDYEESHGKLWYIKYPVKDSDEYVTVATTRPETMLGDTAVAVNPNDERYTHLIGRTAVLPLLNREIPIIADEYVEIEFGTGCVKITPCHDPNDFEVGKRHDLPQILVLDYSAAVNENGGQYCGLGRYEAREQILKDLESAGLLAKTEDIEHNVGACYRCGTVVEPITSMQWFVEMKPLAEPAVDAVNSGEVVFVPDRFKKIYFTWMENIRDWCISRQLWWGHRIPAYYCSSCGEITVAEQAPDACRVCGSHELEQDNDVLDTWFSSALWPFSTLGWPEETDDLKKYYPNDVLVTGFDIIFFWVARMVFSGIEQMGQPPFHHVYVHGLIRDELGRKMSKSLNNGVDPLEMIEKFGADALRAALITGNAAGNDIRWHESKVQSFRNFCNKINNAARFILMNLDGFDRESEFDRNNLINVDKYIISRVNEITYEVSANLDKFELGIAMEKMYGFAWNEFCDWYIEFAKPRLNSDSELQRSTVQNTLHYVFTKILKLLHPFMPFITEEIYAYFDDKPLIISDWPVYSEDDAYKKEQSEITEIIEAVRGIRNARVQLNIPPSKKAKLFITPLKGNIGIYEGNEDIFSRLAGADEVLISYNEADIENALSVHTNTAKFTVPLDELTDRTKEAERLQKERQKAAAEAERFRSRLSNEAFVSKAPEAVVNEEKLKLEKAQALLAEIEESINKLQKK